MSFKSNRIVVPVDFSGESKGALEAASTFGGEIHCVHVLFPLSKITPGVSVDDVTEGDRRTTTRGKLEELTKPFDVTTLEVLVGTPGLEIAEYAKSVRADLIVILSLIHI